jgi:hypothetical protein
MKKLSIILVITLLIGALCACGQPAAQTTEKNTDTTDASEASSSAQAYERPIFHTGDNITYRDYFRVQMTETKELPSDDAESRLFAYYFGIQMLYDGSMTVNSVDFDAFANNIACDVLLSAYVDEPLNGSLSLGRETYGWIVARVPADADWDDVELEFAPPTGRCEGAWKK